MSSELGELHRRLEGMAPERRRLVLCHLRQEGWAVPLEWRPPADAVTARPTLANEVYLPQDIVPSQPPRRWAQEPSAVLLTGGTGFLGAFVLEELLQRTRSTQVYCLVRAPDASSGRKRLEDNLRHRTGRAQLDPRVVAVPGDLSKRRLGLTEGDFDALAQRVDLVLHNGALVNFLYGYDAFLGPNVVGLQEVLRLCCRGALKPVHFVSTLAVFMIAEHPPTRASIPEGVNLELGLGALGGYAQSKWVCESMLDEARRRGLHAVVHRPGLVLGHSQTGVANEDDLLYRTMQGIAQLGASPQTPATVEAVPVDVVSRALVALALADERSLLTYHYLGRERCPVMPVELLTRRGYHLRPVEMEDWLAEIGRTPANALHPLGPLLSARWSGRTLGELLSVRPAIEAAKSLAVVERLAGPLPPTERVLERTLERMEQAGAVPRPQRAHSAP